MLASFFELWIGAHQFWEIVVGVILLDLGMQMTHVSNQARIYALRPDAQNRLNTIYMVSCCVGAGAGSLLGGFAWSRWGWSGVCAPPVDCNSPSPRRLRPRPIVPPHRGRINPGRALPEPG